jgi:uncharacterized Zn finger protein
VSRGSAEEKGRKLLAEGRLTVRFRSSEENGSLAAVFPIVAECRGDSGVVYTLGFDTRSHEWHCTCPARGRCSHLVALQLVTLEPRPGPGGTFPTGGDQDHAFGRVR